MDNQDDTLNPFADPSVVSAQQQVTQERDKTTDTFEYNIQTHATQHSNEFSPNSLPWSQPSTNNTNPINYGPSVPIKDDLDLKNPTINSLAARPNKTDGVFNTQQSQGSKSPNFPHIPPWCSFIPFLKPCFYVNIAEEIPVQHQPLVKVQYYSVLSYCCILLVNIIGVCVYLKVGYPSKVSHFLLGIFLSILFIVFSVMSQFIGLYKAVKKDSQSGYMLFMALSVVFAIVSLVQTIGANGSGWCGFCVVASSFDDKENSSIFLGIISLLCSFGFLYFFIITLWHGYKVRYLYLIAKHRELSNMIQTVSVMPHVINAVS